MLAKSDPVELKLFKSAEAFRYLTVATRRRRTLIVPRITCLAFSLELYLKCLIRIESGKAARGHDLRKLFSKLNQNDQIRIELLYYQEMKSEAYQIQKFGLIQAGLGHRWIEKFDDALRLSAEAFQRFRYLYEEPSDANWWASPICEGTRKLILVHKKDWKRYAMGRHS